MSTRPLERTQEEEASVLAWREHKFLEMRFSAEQAFILANGVADLHEAADLLAAMCPPEIAFDILSD
jgi:hypothetical protein